jgi:hypothetical protein
MPRSGVCCAWELDDAAKAEKLIRNLAQRPGVSKSILEGLDEILTVSKLRLPAELRRSLACTNIIENMMGTVRRNVKRWSSPSMALRWTAAAMHEAKKGFRRLKAFRQLPVLRAALAAHYEKETNSHAVAQNAALSQFTFLYILQRRPVSGDRLLQPRRPALARPERPERSAEIVLRRGPVERHARAGPLL